MVAGADAGFIAVSVAGAEAGFDDASAAGEAAAKLAGTAGGFIL